MREAKIAELKANLSSFLAAVRKGETVIVRDRDTPIARIEPYDQDDDLVVIEAVDGPREAKRFKPRKLKRKVDIDRYLREMREDK